MKPIQKVVPGILRSIAYKRGFSAPQIVLEWEKIVGFQVAQYCWPIRINFQWGKKVEGTLELSALPAWATIISQNSQIYIERINTYFGYCAISRITLKHTQKLAPKSKVL